MNATSIADTWERGDPYEQYVGRWSRRVAPAFITWLGVGPGRRWVDVGCGTGALCAAILDQSAPASVVGVEPSEGFLDRAKQYFGERVSLRRGTSTALPLDAGSADVVVSGLMLNFVPNPAATLAEMKRVTTGAGTIGAYVWDYAGRMELMRIFWDAVVELDSDATRFDEGVRFTLCQPEPLRAVFSGAGLDNVAVTAIEIPTPFTSFDDYWRPFLGGQGPAPAYAMSLPEPVRDRLRERLRERLAPGPDGSIALTARAWAVRGNVP